MLTHLDDLGHRKAFADCIELERVIGDVLMEASWSTHQVLDPNTGLEAAENRAAIADLAKNDVVVQLHFDLLATIDAFGEGNSQARPRDIQDGSVYGIGRTRQDFDLGGILRGIACFAAALDAGRLNFRKGLPESSSSSHRMID